MLTPCCPNAGPIGGEGVALPAFICNFMFAITFFAILITLIDKFFKYRLAVL
jgi:hypothetical protein